MAIRVLGPQAAGATAVYFTCPRHAELSAHYVGGRNGGSLLGFTVAWKGQHLLPGIGEAGYTHGQQQLRCVLLDAETGQLHNTNMAPAYDIISAPREGGGLLDESHQEVPRGRYTFLQSYFYCCHHCPCHRKHDLRAQCQLDLDGECAGNRFQIERITPLDRPDLILLSEVHAPEALEEFLLRGR